MQSIFIQKSPQPTPAALKKALGDTFELWTTIAEYTKKASPGAVEEWKYSGEKYGWSFRISDKKRVLVYLLPRDQFFKVGLVFGQKATDKILETKISASIINDLRQAKVYAEGRGIRIEVKDRSLINDIKELVRIKTEH